MAARIIVVHDEPEFIDRASAALQEAGHEVSAFPDPIDAMDALTGHSDIKVLITRVQFPPGRSNGLALARMARVKILGIQIVIIGQPQFSRDAEALGAFTPAPVDFPKLAEAVSALLAAGDGDLS